MVPPDRQVQSAKFNVADKNISRPRNLTDWMQAIGTSLRWTIWTTAESRLQAYAEAGGKVRTKDYGSEAWAETGLLVVLKFLVPSHLNGFELSFVR
jgi:hypothetical protein